MRHALLFLLNILVLWNLSNADGTDELVFECDFQNDACGLFNDVDHEAKWEREFVQLGGRLGTMMVVKTRGKRKQMARLLSPILDQHSSGVGGCLSFELFTAGDGVTAVRVKQQDASGVLTLIGVHTQTSKWRKYNLHADVEDYIRLIFEAQVNPNRGGTVVAIDNIAFRLGECTS